MSLDLYRANTRENIDFNGDFVGIEDTLQEFLYKNRDKIKGDVECIYAIDPYGDTQLNDESIKKIIEVCRVIRTEEYLSDYEDADEAIEIFDELEDLCVKAIESHQHIYAIGD